MNFALLWMDALLVSLLWVAACAAFVGRIKRKWIRISFTPIVLGVPLFVLGTFVFAATATKFVTKIQPDWFYYSVSLLMAYLLGASLVLRQAARREPGLPPAAESWRRGSLAVAFLLTVAIGYMTLVNMDLAIRARCALLSVKMNSIYLASLPAITSDSQKPALIYEQALARLADSRDEEEKVNNPPTGNNDNFDPDEPATISFLSHAAPTLALLRQAAAMPGCRFDVDLSDPDVEMGSNRSGISFLNQERNAANVLNLHAREELAHGHAAPAIADAAAIFGMSRHFMERPTILAALVGSGIDAIGNKTLERSLPYVKNQGDLAALTLQNLQPLGRGFQQALRGEEVWGLSTFENMPGDLIIFRVFFLDLDNYLTLMKEGQDAAPQPYYKIRDMLPHFKKGYVSYLGPSILWPFETCARAEAIDDCAQTAVAMTRYRLDHAKLPSHLSDLVPAYLDAIPTDPFDGHPLRLAIKNGTWIIYSVGPDLVDDGGVPIVKGKGDVIFTLRATPETPTTSP